MLVRYHINLGSAQSLMVRYGGWSEPCCIIYPKRYGYELLYLFIVLFIIETHYVNVILPKNLFTGYSSVPRPLHDESRNYSCQIIPWPRVDLEFYQSHPTWYPNFPYSIPSQSLAS